MSFENLNLCIFNLPLHHGANAGQTSYNEDVHWGWVAGAGVEYAFSSNWSAKVEYLHMDFNKYSSQTSADIPFDFENKVDTVRFGLNYKFN